MAGKPCGQDASLLKWFGSEKEGFNLEEETKESISPVGRRFPGPFLAYRCTRSVLVLHLTQHPNEVAAEW